MNIGMMVYSLDGRGGIAKHMLSLCRELMAMGNTVDVWAVEYDPDQCYPELTAGMNIRFLRLPQRASNDISTPQTGNRMLNYLYQLWLTAIDQRRLVQAMPSHYDVINPHGNLIHWGAAEYKRRHGTPVTWMCNDFWPAASHQYEVSKSAAGKLKHVAKQSLTLPFDQYDQWAVHMMDAIVVLSETVQGQMNAHYRVNSNIVRTGITIGQYNPSEQGIRERCGFSAEQFLLLTVCLLMPRRRLEDVIDAVQILRNDGLDVGYVIAGRTNHTPAYTQFLKEKVSAAGLEEQVKFLGEVTEQELLDCYSACDTFVWSADEGQSWGMACMEAMAAGKPAIVSRANGLAEVLEDRENALLIPPRSPVAIANAVKHLMNDTALKSHIAHQGQQLVHTQYSWRSNAETMMHLFNQKTRTRQINLPSLAGS